MISSLFDPTNWDSNWLNSSMVLILASLDLNSSAFLPSINSFATTILPISIKKLEGDSTFKAERFTLAYQSKIKMLCVPTISRNFVPSILYGLKSILKLCLIAP